MGVGMMDANRITVVEGDGAMPFRNNRVFVDGHEIRNMSRCVIELDCDEFNKVTLEFVAHVGGLKEKVETPPSSKPWKSERKLPMRFALWVISRLRMTKHSEQSLKGYTDSDRQYYRGYNDAIENCCFVIQRMSEGL